MLQQGRREIESVIAKQKELGLVSQQNTEVALKFNVAVMDTQQAFRGVFLELSLAVLPVLTRFLDIITPAVEYLRQHIDLVKGALIGIGAIAAGFLAVFIVMNAMVVGIAVGIAALIALFALAYEDVKYFLEGQKSLIGDILKKWPLVGVVAKAAFEGLKETLWALIAPFRLIESLVEKIFSYFKGPNKTLTVDIKNGQGLLNQASTSPFNPITPASLIASRTFSPSRSISTGPITINTQATDADGIAAGLQNGLNEHLWQSNSNFDDGVLA